MKLGLNLSLMWRGGELIISVTIASDASGTLGTATPPTGFLFKEAAIVITIPAAGAGTEQTVNATIYAGGDIVEDTPGDFAAALIASGQVGDYTARLTGLELIQAVVPAAIDSDGTGTTVSALFGTTIPTTQAVTLNGVAFTLLADGSLTEDSAGAWEASWSALNPGETDTTTAQINLTDGNSKTVTATLTVTVTGANVVTAAGNLADLGILPNVAMTAFDVTEDFTDKYGGGLTYSLAPSSGALPAGLSLSSAGVVTGTPTETVYGRSIVYRATDAYGSTADSAHSMTVAATVAYTSSQTGDWDDASTWGGAGVPLAKDTVTISSQHVVTVPSGVSVISGAITMAAGSGTRTKLSVAGQFDMAGDIATAANCEITLAAGSTFDMNGNDINKGGSTWFTFSGTAGSRITFKSTGSAGTIPQAVQPTTAAMSYVDFVGIGLAEYGRSHTSAIVQSFSNCTWTGCGAVHLQGIATNAGSGYSISGCDFRDPASTSAGYYPHVYDTSATTTATREIVGCTWDAPTVSQMPEFRCQAATISECVFSNALLRTSNYNQSFSDCLFYNTDCTGNLRLNSVSDSYFYSPGLSYHYLGYIHDADFSLTDNVVEGEPGSASYGCNFALATTPWTGNVSITGNVLIGEPGTLLTFTASGAAGTINVTNNTIVADNAGTGNDYPLAILTEGAGDITGGTVNFYNNIVVDSDASNTRDNAIYLRTATASQIDILQNNCGYGLNPDGTTSPPLLYVNCSTTGSGDISADPQFVDATRDFAAWGASIGITATADSVIAHMLARNSTTTPDVSALVSWVRGGYAPQNTALSTAGYSSDLIGAMSVV